MQAMLEHLADFELCEAYFSIEVMKTEPYNLAGRSMHLILSSADRSRPTWLPLQAS
jgi:hypothetical protein